MTNLGGPRIGLVLEQALGHRTHAANLRSVIGAGSGVEPVWLPVGHELTGLAARLPGLRNWTVQTGVAARRAIARAHRATPLDALFFHTQVPSVLSFDWLDRIPSVVSLDATPLQYDELGPHYAHTPSAPWLEDVKWRANHRALARAHSLVAWSRWAADGLVDGYGVSADKVHVLAPGVRPAEWTSPAPRAGTDGGTPVRILFVGADFARKGGPLLLDAFHDLQASLAATAMEVELDIVTTAAVEATPGVTVHRDLGPNSRELRSLYHRADLFCLPTLGDCLPMVLAEAGAAGLPLVATRVGAIPELVRDGCTGLLVEPGDRAGLAAALRRLVVDRDLRGRLGEGAAELVRLEHDAERNAAHLVELLRAAAGSPPARGDDRIPAGAEEERHRRVLVTVSGTIDRRISEQIAAGSRPRADYLELASAFGGADLMDHDRARGATGWTGRLVERVAGRDILLAWACFRQAGRYDAIFTDGEQVGLPLALLFRLRGRRAVHHSMIVHILSVPKKALLVRLFDLGRHIDLFLTYSSWQARALTDQLHVPAERVVLTPFMVDTHFFTPRAAPAADSRTICAVGLECRDYPTLLQAADGLDARVVIAASSPWSKRPDPTEGRQIPDNVEVCRLDFSELRRLYGQSRFLVMPLLDVPFQAGVTAILEAMSMGKAVVCTRTPGQTDVIVDGETGLYVPPSDPDALRAAIQRLLDDPEEADRMGRAAHRAALERYDVASYAAGLADHVLGHLGAAVRTGPRGSDVPADAGRMLQPASADLAPAPD